MPGDHIEETRLERYAMGTLPETARPAIDEHLLVCPDCQARLVQIDTFIAAFKPAVRELDPLPAPGYSSFFRLPKLAWPAALLAMAGVLLFLVSRGAPRPVVPAVIQMQSLRGSEHVARLAAGQPAVLVFNVPGDGARASYAIEVVDRSGQGILTQTAAADGETLRVPVHELREGAYWVRVYSTRPQRELFAEYALRVGTPAGDSN